MSTKTTTESPLLTAHRDAVAAYEEAAKLVPTEDLTKQMIAGRRAGAVRRINDCELELVIEGIAFEPWVAPRKVATRTHSRTDAQLLARLETVEMIRDDATKPDNIRHTAETHARTLRAQAIARGLIDGPEVAPDPAKPKRGRKSKSAGDQLGEVEAKLAA